MDYGSVISVIIPSFNPSDRLVQVINGLIESGFDDIIVVNDGSGQGHAARFEQIGQFPQVTVLTHPKNLGKGSALKTAFLFFMQARPGKKGVVTMDGDGQHLKGDVVKCAIAAVQSDEALVMGVRNFSHPDVPKRNAMGNRFTAFIFRAFFGIRLRDTQTGLRGIPTRHIPLMLDIHGSRFEYETNMLLELRRRGIPFTEVEIETVYEERSNDRSHFRPLIDSVMIFARIFKYALSGILSFAVDISIFWLTMTLFGAQLGRWSILGCTAAARAVSSFFNFNVNRRLVFAAPASKRKNMYGRHLRRYYTLAIMQMLAAAGALWILAFLLGGMRSAGPLSLLKILVDTALFFLSYYIQHKWVFDK